MRIRSANARLNLLPGELHEIILNELVTDRDLDEEHYYRALQPLCALSAVCKELHKVVEPILYRVYRSWNRSSVAPFLRTLCEWPHIGFHVQQLKLFNNHISQQHSTPSLSEIERYTKALDKFVGFSAHRDMMAALEVGCHTARLALILLLAPNVQQLELDVLHPKSICGCQRFANYLVAFLQWSFKANHLIYTGLRRLTIKPHWTGPSYSYRELDKYTHHLAVEFMQLPRLDCVILTGLNFTGDKRRRDADTNQSYPPPIVYPTRSRVSELIMYSGIDSQEKSLDPTYLIDTCASLKRLEIQGYDINHINNFLPRHASSLEKLSLLRTSQCLNGICDLHEFKQLRELEIPALRYSGLWVRYIPRLPVSLKSLTVRMHTSLGNLFELARTSVSKLPPELKFLCFTCNIFDQRNDKYLDLIKETDFGEADVFSQTGLDWIVFMSRGGSSGITLQCRREHRSISDIVNDIHGQIWAVANPHYDPTITPNVEKGIKTLLNNYPWPAVDTTKQAELVSIRSIARYVVANHGR